ncbi:helix-turn-helix transcriptional regulator [Niallia circulans]|jgi:transcriptional regulator with XRE-family HTH domain|uniref:helix-turn-helix domain-containing protein n=1 Tax=Niallia TaxID=2837506 RepID=UPI0009E1F0D9|nr:helix-turn-helix transcriptional regulator [Niallia circulans]MED5099304.1 helix-turn-helix transcriptional regulator [Niallia circulans]NRG30454.1 helix-turn-helix transcriptional regulator [Niallia circulans]PAE13565.1 XRE family transcriptional regulator [Niallia circulans]
MNFPERLRQLRKSANISQQTLGNAMNVTKVSISGYETGNRKPDTDTLQKLADYFDVSTDYLLGRSEAKETRASYHSKVSDNSMTSEEAELLTQLQKYPTLYNHLINNPEKTVSQLYRLWRFLEDEKQNK